MRTRTLRDLTWGLAALTVVALAAVVLIELLALSPGATGAGDAVALRPIVRIAAASTVGLLIVTLVLRQRDRARPAVPSAEWTDEEVTEAESFSSGTKRFALIAAIVMVLLGILGLGSSLIGLGILPYAPLVGAVSLAFVVGGIIGVIQAGRSLAGTPSRRLHLPAPWMMILAFVLTVAAGEVTRRAGGETALSFVPLLFLGAALPPLVALSLAASEVGRPPSRRRVLMAMVAGGTVSGLAAVALEILLPGIVALLVLPLGEILREGFALIDQGKFSDLLGSPAALLVAVELAIVAPFVEEATKPLAVVLLGRRIQHQRDALLIGMGCGAGFAIVENIMYEAGGLNLWTGITVIRGIGGALHPFTAGLVSLGWFAVAHRRPGAWRLLARNYLIAVGLHALWNGAVAIFFLLESADRGVLGPVNLQGQIIDVALLALFLAEGIGLILTARLLARGFAAGAPPAPLPTPAPARALAVWGIACMGVLLPVAVAAGGAILRHVAGALLP